MIKILVVDNYDSFTYNLVYLLRRYAEVAVMKNDEVEILQAGVFDKILFSPGPGIPSEAGNMKELIEHFAGIKPMLGICLGHQAIAEVFGGELLNLSPVYHGLSKPVNILPDNSYIFNGIPDTFLAGRYHSWAVKSDSVPNQLQVTAVDDNGIIMALKHKTKDIHGVQFHPESIMTECGEKIIANWVNH
jgi:anthranilate synthase component 2